MATTGNKVASDCGDRIRLAVRSYGLQKQLAAEVGISDTELSKFLDSQLPKLARLLSALGLEVVEAGEVDDLKRSLKRYL